MKQSRLALIVLFAVMMSLPLVSESIYKAQKNANDGLVSNQKTADLERKKEILRKMRIYMGEINSRLKQDPEIKTVVDSPVKTDDITDVKKTTEIHSKKNVPDPVYGYAKADGLKLYSEPGAMMTVGKLGFGDKVQVILRSDIDAALEDNVGKYILVRKADETEGWIEEYYISNTLPEEKPKIQDIPKTVDTGKGFSVPTAGRRTSDFGYRVHPVTKKSGSFHSGIDIAAPLGTPVYAAAAGDVKIAEFHKGGYGNLIVLLHDSDLTTYYGHLSKIGVAKGAHVNKGDLIGNVGSTGMSTGPHLHFEVRKSDKALNPDDYIR